MSIKKQFGKQIAEYRSKLDLSQEKLAELIGVSRNTISRIERGLTFPRNENLAKIIKILNLEDTDLKKDKKLSLIFDKLSLLNEKDLDLINTMLDTLIKNSI